MATGVLEIAMWNCPWYYRSYTFVSVNRCYFNLKSTCIFTKKVRMGDYATELWNANYNVEIRTNKHVAFFHKIDEKHFYISKNRYESFTSLNCLHSALEILMGTQLAYHSDHHDTLYEVSKVDINPNKQIYKIETYKGEYNLLKNSFIGKEIVINHCDLQAF